MSHRLVKAATVYRKSFSSDGDYVIVTMQLPKGTLINKPLSYSGKNRASVALVKKITVHGRRYGRKKITEAFPLMSSHNDGTVYRLGEVVTPKRGFATTPDECAGGIHFFRSLSAAKDYN